MTTVQRKEAVRIVKDNDIHSNDNDTTADRDLVGASYHFLHYVELMYRAQEYNYNKFFTTDASPRIFDVIAFFSRHSEVTTGAYNLAKTLNRDKISDMMHTEDYNGLMKMVNKEIYRI
jgi:xylose isomerase